MPLFKNGPYILSNSVILSISVFKLLPNLFNCVNTSTNMFDPNSAKAEASSLFLGAFFILVIPAVISGLPAIPVQLAAADNDAAKAPFGFASSA